MIVIISEYIYGVLPYSLALLPYQAQDEDSRKEMLSAEVWSTSTSHMPKRVEFNC